MNEKKFDWINYECKEWKQRKKRWKKIIDRHNFKTPSSGRKINRLNRSWTLSLYDLKENHFIKIHSSSIPLFSCCLLSLALSAWHLSLFSCLQNVYCHFKLVFCDYREIVFLLLSLLIMRGGMPVELDPPTQSQQPSVHRSFQKCILECTFAFVIRLSHETPDLHVIINMLFRKLWCSTFDKNFTHERTWLQLSHCLSVSGLFSRSIRCVKPIMNWQNWCQQLHNAERLTCSLHYTSMRPHAKPKY